MKLTPLFYTRALGIIGMIFPIIANFIPPSDLRAVCFVLGGALMLVTAAWERELFFTVLQLIVLAGASMHFTPFTPLVKGAVPILIALSAIGYFAYSGKLNDKLTVLGSVGITILGIGYAVANPLIYLLGGIFLTVYATLSFRRGVTIAILWAILNFIFIFAVLINIYRFGYV